MDVANEGDLASVQVAVPDLPVVGVSIIDDESLIALKEAVWKLTGLIRVYLRHDKQVDAEPLAMERGPTILDVATKVHKELGATCRGARIWDPSACFDGQRVGCVHPVQDGYRVEIIT
jgi:ribosome-interacting GTPase 1